MPPTNDDEGTVMIKSRQFLILIVHHGGMWLACKDILINWENYYEKNYTGLIAYDNQVGSGYSDSLHGRRQYFDSIDTLSDDLSKFIKDTRSNYPGNIPILVLGESFGATVALHSILRPPSAPSPTITPTADDADDDATTLLTTDDIYLVQ